MRLSRWRTPPNPATEGGRLPDLGGSVHPLVKTGETWHATLMKNETTFPALGDVKTEVTTFNKRWFVHVKVYKANTLRGDSYWVTEGLREFKTESAATSFANRYAS